MVKLGVVSLAVFLCAVTTTSSFVLDHHVALKTPMSDRKLGVYDPTKTTTKTFASLSSSQAQSSGTESDANSSSSERPKRDTNKSFQGSRRPSRGGGGGGGVGRSFSSSGGAVGRSFSSSGGAVGRSFSSSGGAVGRSFSSSSRRPGGGGGGGEPVLRLENPLKLQRIAFVPAPRSQRKERENSGDRRGNGGRGNASRDNNRGQSPPRKVAGIASDDGTKTTKAPGGGGGDFGRQRRPERKKKSDNKDTDGRNRRASLRIGGGKKGRRAELSQRRGSLKKRDRSRQMEEKLERALERRTVQLPDGPLAVSALAEILDEKPVAVIKFLMTDLGVMASMTQNLDPATCVAVAEGFGKIVGGDEDEDEEDDEEFDEDSALAQGFAFDEDDEEDLELRPPVVTIMGHVDHGKTSLLDAIRNTRVTAGEAGGITQHIAAYQVDREDNKITFIDTPGHAAFTDMRERGANITDIVILVVAADDGVKQQTADSIACARQAGVPLVIAINKCDLETADPMKVMTELTSYDILTEEFGGEVQCSQISAKKGTNLDDLLDKVKLQAELQDLKANPDREADGIVIEAYLEKGLGTVATTLVKRGTLKIGDVFVAGNTYGRVRALISTTNNSRLKEAGPSTPVKVVGFEGVPNAGDTIVVVEDEQSARELAESRTRIAREQSASAYAGGLMESVNMQFSATKQKREMFVVVKADVQGSAEALARSLSELKLENDEAVVTVRVLIAQTGEVSKSDIAIASVAPGTTVIAFGVAASYVAMEDARTSGIDIEYYSIVYDAIESVESRMQEVLSPTPEGEYVGSAIVQEVFNIGGTGNIAGSKCRDGYIRKGANIRVMRGDKILVETKVSTLRSFKAETDTIEEGNDCGIGLIDFEDFQPDDVIECYVE